MYLKRSFIFCISGLRYENLIQFLVVVVESFLFGRRFLLHVVNDLQWKSIILGYCKYDFPFLLFSVFCDWQCQHSVYVEIRWCKVVFKGMIGRKLYGNISMCRFPVDFYVYAEGVSLNGKI